MTSPNSTSTSTSQSKSDRNAKPAIPEAYDELKSDISKLSQSVKSYAGEQVSAVAGDAQAMAKQKLGEVESIVRRSPVQSALIAGGLGLLVGLILTR